MAFKQTISYSVLQSIPLLPISFKDVIHSKRIHIRLDPKSSESGN